MILAVNMNPAIDKIYILDGFDINEVHRPVKTIASPGGKGLNVARVAKLMGKDVAVTGFLGGGNGAFISKKVKELGLVDRFQSIDEETRICINVTDTKGKTCTEVLESGPVITSSQSDDFLETFESLLVGTKVVTLSGSLPKGLDTNFYNQLILLCHKHNVKVLLDTSGAALFDGIQAAPFAVKPNVDEIKSLYDGPVDNLDELAEAVRFFKRKGIDFPMISLGKNGSVVGLEDGIYKVSFPSVNIINTVGSGDSFIAGLAVAISEDKSLKESVKMATACGTVNACYEQTGYVTKEEVESFMNKIHIERFALY